MNAFLSLMASSGKDNCWSSCSKTSTPSSWSDMPLQSDGDDCRDSDLSQLLHSVGDFSIFNFNEASRGLNLASKARWKRVRTLSSSSELRSDSCDGLFTGASTVRLRFPNATAIITTECEKELLLLQAVHIRLKDTKKLEAKFLYCGAGETPHTSRRLGVMTLELEDRFEDHFIPINPVHINSLDPETM